MATKKKVTSLIKLQIPGGQANPSPPVGPALGQAGVNIMDFCKAFNAATQGDTGTLIPVVISVFEDRGFTFVTKQPPASSLIKQMAGIAKGSSHPSRDSVGTITRDQLKQVAEKKMPDLNAYDVEAAMKIMEGSARSMGIKIKD